MTKPRFDLLKIEAYHCYRCGNPFTGKGRKKTGHHSIPKFLKPQRNVEVPVCENCHKEINQYTVQSIPKFNAINNLIEGLKAVIKSYEKKLERYKIEEEEKNGDLK